LVINALLKGQKNYTEERPKNQLGIPQAKQQRPGCIWPEQESRPSPMEEH